MQINNAKNNAKFSTLLLKRELVRINPQIYAEDYRKIKKILKENNIQFKDFFSKILEALDFLDNIKTPSD